MINKNNHFEITPDQLVLHQSEKNLPLPIFPHTFLEKLQHGVNSLIGEVSQLRQEGRSQYSDIKTDTEAIKDAVMKQPKTKQIRKPSRSLFSFDEPKPS